MITNLLAAAAAALAGPDSGFSGATWTDESTAHGRREQPAIRTLVIGVAASASQ